MGLKPIKIIKNRSKNTRNSDELIFWINKSQSSLPMSRVFEIKSKPWLQFSNLEAMRVHNWEIVCGLYLSCVLILIVEFQWLLIWIYNWISKSNQYFKLNEDFDNLCPLQVYKKLCWHTTQEPLICHRWLWYQIVHLLP